VPPEIGRTRAGGPGVAERPVGDHHLDDRPLGSAGLTPDQASPDSVNIIAESTGVNVFIEVRKPRP